MEKENVLLKQFEHVVNEIKKDRFSSHDFIGRYTQLYEREWKSFLNRYETKAAQKTHAYLSRMLSMYVKKNLIRLIKETKMNKSKNIHARRSNVTWWQKVATCIILLMSFPIMMVAQRTLPFAYDESEWKSIDKDLENYERITTNVFNEQLKGWEWTYLEKSTEEQIKTPYLNVTYRKYASHPQYHVPIDCGECRKINVKIEGKNEEIVVPKAVYDTQGKLLQILYFWPGEMFYDYTSASSQATKLAINRINYRASQMVNELRTMVANSSKLSKSLHVIPDSGLTRSGEFVACKVLWDKDTQQTKKGAYLKALNKLIETVNSGECKRQKLFWDTKAASYVKRPVSEHKRPRLLWGPDGYLFFEEPGTSFQKLHDSILKENMYDFIVLSNAKSSISYASVLYEDSICLLEMIKDYKNNKYDVKNRENAETCRWIEYGLGLRDKPTVQNDKKSEDGMVEEIGQSLKDETSLLICNMLELPVDEKYLKLDDDELQAEVKKLHPKWTDIEIRQRLRNMKNELSEYSVRKSANLAETIILEAARTVASSESQDNSSEDRALHYLNFLKNEYWYSYTSIKRIDALSFQATIKVEPNNTIYNVIVRYKSDGPYQYTWSYELMP